MRKLILLGALLLACSSAWAAEAIDATSSNAGLVGPNVATSFSWSHTVCSGCTDPVLVVQVAYVAPTNATDFSNWVTSVTFNGTAGKLVQSDRDHGGSEMYILQYAFVNPSSGAHSIIVNLSVAPNTGYIAGSAVSVTGINETYPVRLGSATHSGSTNGATMTATCSDAVSGDFIVGLGHGHQGTITANGTQTAIFTSNGFGSANSTSWGSGYIAAATRNTLIWTQTTQVFTVGCIALRPDTETPTRPVFDTFASVQNAALTTATASSVNLSYMAPSGSNTALLYLIAYDDTATTDNITAVSYGAAGMTKLTSCINANGNSDEVFYLLNPAPGTSTISVTLKAGVTLTYFAIAETWFLVNQGSPFGTVATANLTGSQTLTVSATSTASGIVHDVFSIFGSDEIPTQAELASLIPNGNHSDNADIGMSQRANGTGSSVAMGWTKTNANGFCGQAFNINFGATVAGGSFVNKRRKLESLIN